MRLLLAFVVATMPLTAEWIRPLVSIKFSELSALAFIGAAVVSLSVRGDDELRLVRGTKPLLLFLATSLISYLLFLSTSSIPSYVFHFSWARGLQEPPLYNFAIIGRQALYIALFVLICSMDIRQKWFRRLVSVHLWTATLVGLVAIGQMTAHLVSGTEFGIVDWVVPRISGTATEPAPFAVYLLSALPITINLLATGSTRIVSRPVLLGMLVVQLVAELLTFSVAGYGILAVVLIVMAVKHRSYRYIVLSGGVLVILLGVTWLFVPGVSQFFSESIRYKVVEYLTAREGAAASGGRVAGLYIAPRMFLDEPFLGIGTGNYPVLRNEWEYLRGLPTATWQDLPANHYLQILAEQGLVGLSLFLFAVVSFVRSVRPRLRKLGQRHAPATWGLLFGAIALYIDLFVSSFLFFSYVWVVPALMYHGSKCGESVGSPPG